MQPRIDIKRSSPDSYKAMLALQTYVNGTDLEAPLKELVKIRASQINGCAFCLHMHSRDARKGVSRRSGRTCSGRGARRRCSMTASARRWRGQKR